jgi:hypothetical protein
MNADGSETETLVPKDILGISWQPLPAQDESDEETAPDEAEPEEGEEVSEDEPEPGFGECPGSRGGDDWTSPTTFVAGGNNNGIEWRFCARTATTDMEVTKEGGETQRGEGEGLCLNFVYGDGPGSGMDCEFIYDGNDELRALDAGYSTIIGNPENGYLYGAAPAAAASVEFVQADGSTEGSIYPAPDELDVEFQFFTVFGVPGVEGELLVRDADGEVIERKRLDPE